MRSAESPLSRRAAFPGLRAFACAMAAALVLAACGGGGGGGSTTTAATGTTTTTTTAVPTVTNTNTGTGSTVVPVGSNVIPLVVDSGPAGVAGRIANVPYATVTICPPGSTANCQTIDHVLVDTGSTGLRVFASALRNTQVFPQLTTGAGLPYAECGTFIGGYTWGSVRGADVVLGGLTAPALPIQVIADPAYPTVPASCSGTGTSQNSVALLGANGVLGVGVFTQDCGSACAGSALAAAYYACTGTSCVPSAVPLAQQLTQPISRLPSDNNGSMIVFPAVASGGQATVAGSLVAGIGTRANNAVGTAVAYGVSNSTGYLNTTYNGRTYNRAAFDSGSNFYFFTDAALTPCAGSSTVGTATSYFYCPPTVQTLTALVTGTNNVATNVNFRIANATSQFASAGNAAIPDVGASIGSTTGFLWGLPFYFGRSVFTALQGQSTPLGTGPYVGF